MNGDDTPQSVTRPGVGALAAGAAACTACCAGPILGALGAIGVASAVGYALVGVVAIMAGIDTVAVVVVLRRRRRSTGVAPTSTVAPIDAPTTRQPETPTGREAAARRPQSSVPT